MSEGQFKIIGLGEVLFDVLPTGKTLGGAPANFAYIAKQLGNNGLACSRIGNDELGKDLLNKFQNKNLSTDFIQIDEKHRTGIVNVTLKNGQPSYEIVKNVAWDFLELSENWQDLAKDCDAVCFGSLAQRNAVSRETIQGFIKLTKPDCLRIFDVNLRQNYFSPDILRESLNLANVVKMNHEELPLIVEMLGITSANQIDQAKNLREKFGLKLICVTRGASGSLLLDENETSEHSGIKVKIADTIGAGDAFTATLTHGILHHQGLPEINEKANRIGAFVASNIGAMPKFSIEQLTI